MIKKLALLTAFAGGYVLGAKAGEARYRQIVAAAEKVRGRPEVQKAADTVHEAVIDLSDRAKGVINEQVEKVTSDTETPAGHVEPGA
jgi:hypothetical protein